MNLRRGMLNSGLQTGKNSNGKAFDFGMGDQSTGSNFLKQFNHNAFSPKKKNETGGRDI